MRAGWLLLGPASEPPPPERWLAAAERERLEELRFPPRRADWLRGRWAAKLALAAWHGAAPADDELRRFTVLADPRGVPIVRRDGIVLSGSLSISHRAGYALAAVAETEILGCDLELVEPRSPAFVADYFTARERSLVDNSPATERDLLANLIWSCKESALKALADGLRRDTREVEIEIQPRASGGWAAFAARISGDRPFCGLWSRRESLLLTLAASTLLTLEPLASPAGDQI